MELIEIGSFEAAHEHLAWPWIAVDPSRRRFAFVTAAGALGQRVETRTLEGFRALAAGASFPLPDDLGLPTKAAPETGHRGAESGLHGFAIDGEGTLLALTGVSEGVSVVVTVDATGERARTRVDALTGGDFTAHAVTFDRGGTRLWLSAESGEETAIVLLEAHTHALLGVVRSAPLPPPSYHELHVHPQDDAVLLVAACGQDGTFTRVAGFAQGPPVAVPSPLERGSVPSSFVGFSSDGARVHFVEADELRTHAWPGLEELSSVELADGFVSVYGGAVLGPRVFVDGENTETGDDAVMAFDRAALRGVVASDPVPSGMWVGRLGADMIVTVAAKGEPALGHVLQLPAPAN
jgi:hypothetical protein